MEYILVISHQGFAPENEEHPSHRDFVASLRHPQPPAAGGAN